MKIIIKNPGESLIEVVVATVMISTVIIAGVSLLTQALDINVNVKHRVIATGLAQEGLENVRNIRDTNWLKYSGDRRSKWVCIDTPSDPNACAGSGISAIVLSEGISEDFRLIKSSDHHYLLQTNLDEDFRLYEQGSTLSHDSSGEKSLFSRKITLTLEKDSNCSTATSTTLPAPDCNDVLDVISRVYWRDAQGDQSVTLQTKLYDFWERSQY